MKNLIITIMAFSCLALMFFCVRLYRNSLIKPKPKMFVEKFMELQVEASCKQIDAKVGPEVKRLFNAKAEVELPILFNQYAAPYHTASGAPKENEDE